MSMTPSSGSPATPPTRSWAGTAAFLQGPETDPSKIAVIREALDTGRDATAGAVELPQGRHAVLERGFDLGGAQPRSSRSPTSSAPRSTSRDRVHREQELARLAHTDPVTGLHNRDELTSRVDQLIAGMSAADGLALVFLDLDGFHRINEDFDFETGNLVLAEVAGTAVVGHRARRSAVPTRSRPIRAGHGRAAATGRARGAGSVGSGAGRSAASRSRCWR